MPVWWHIKATWHCLISFIKSKTAILMFIYPVPAIPCCFQSQKGKKVLFIGFLNPPLFYQSLNQNRAMQVSYLSCLGWNELSAGSEYFRERPGCGIVGTTQGCSGRMGAVRTEVGSQHSWILASWSAWRLHEEFRRWEERPVILVSRCREDGNEWGKPSF